MTDDLLVALRQRGFRHVSPTYRALGYAFAFQCQDPEVGEYLGSLFELFQSSGQPQATYAFGAIEDAGRSNYLLYCDDRMLDNHRRPSVPFATLLWHINRSVVRTSQDRMLLHASAVARGEVSLLFPAAMESGKTTLAAGLVRAGFDYVTDETVAINMASGSVEPFPRALSVDPGSWGVLSDLRPQVSPEIEPYLDRQWQIPPLSIRPGCVADVTRPRFVITPSYVAGGTTELTPIGRAEGVSVLAEHSFNFSRHGRAGLRLLADLARGAACYRLQVGDLVQACRIITELVDASARGKPELQDGSALGGGAHV